MSFWQSLKWVNRHGTSCACLALLLIPVAVLHLLAVAKIELLNAIPLGDWPARLVRNMAGIQFFHANWWFAALYLLFFFGVVISMEIRSIPRWAFWTAFVFLSLPILGYLLTCMRVGGCGCICTLGPIRGP